MLEIGFSEVACAIIGFLFGLLVSWTTKMHSPPESEIVKEMLAMLKKKEREYNGLFKKKDNNKKDLK